MTAQPDTTEQIDLSGEKSTEAQRRIIRELLGLTADLPTEELMERLVRAKCDGIKSEEDAINQIKNEEHERLMDDNHEVIEVFKNAGLALPHDLYNYNFKEMLNEDSKYQKTREGCGFTQASRFLARWVKNKTGKLRTQEDRAYQEFLETIDLSNMKPESQLILRLLADIYDARLKKSNVTELPNMQEKITIEKCTTAELYFLDYLHNTNPIRGSDKINIILDEKGEALFIEKTGGLGQKHSAISLKPFYVNGVLIPPGSLVYLKYSDKKIGPPTLSRKGNIVQSSDLEGVEFLRFTPLVVKPEDRGRAFWPHVYSQLQSRMPGATQATVQDFIDKARSETDPNMPADDRTALIRRINRRNYEPARRDLTDVSEVNDLQKEAKQYLELRKKYLIDRERERAVEALKYAEQEKVFERARRIYEKLEDDQVFKQIHREEALKYIKSYAEAHPDCPFYKEHTGEMTSDGWLVGRDGKPDHPVTGYDVGLNSESVVLTRAVKEFERRFPEKIAELGIDI